VRVCAGASVWRESACVLRAEESRVSPDALSRLGLSVRRKFRCTPQHGLPLHLRPPGRRGRPSPPFGCVHAPGPSRSGRGPPRAASRPQGGAGTKEENFERAHATRAARAPFLSRPRSRPSQDAKKEALRDAGRRRFQDFQAKRGGKNAGGPAAPPAVENTPPTPPSTSASSLASALKADRAALAAARAANASLRREVEQLQELVGYLTTGSAAAGPGAAAAAAAATAAAAAVAAGEAGGGGGAALAPPPPPPPRRVPRAS